MVKHYLNNGQAFCRAGTPSLLYSAHSSFKNLASANDVDAFLCLREALAGEVVDACVARFLEGRDACYQVVFVAGVQN